MTGGVKEGAARAVLRDVWRQGHDTVELRQDGKRLIFFCTLCSTRCYSDCALSDHLNGNGHARRYAGAVAKLSSPSLSLWPFNDGLVFLFPSSKTMAINPLDSRISCSGGGSSSNSNVYCAPKWIGCAHVYTRVVNFSNPSQAAVKAVWCTWLGEKREEEQENNCNLGECEYAIVSFPYSHSLGRGGAGARVSGNAISNSSFSPMEIDTEKKTRRRRKKKGRPLKSNSHAPMMIHVEEVNSLEDLGPTSQHLDDLVKVDPEEAVTVATSGCNHVSNPKEVADDGGEGDGDDGNIMCRMLLSKKNLSNRALRRAFRRQRLRGVERLCFICHQQMLPGKDVATLLNRKTGLIACSSRNRRGSFHVFHTSCLIDWVLLCESKIWLSQMNGGKGGGRRKNRWSVGEHQQKRKQQTSGPTGKPTGGSSSHCASVFCPECQGTGLKTRGGQLEVPRYRLAQVFDWILELIQSRKSWIDNPEQLQECATGLLFCPADNSQGTVISMLLLHFYGSNGSEFGSRPVPCMVGRPHIV